MRPELAGRMHDYYTGVTTAGNTNESIVDTTSLTDGDDYFAQSWLRITGGLGAGTANTGLVKRIRSQKQISQMCKVWGTFTACCSASTSYEIYRRIHPDKYTDAMNEASRMCYPALYRYIEDESLTVLSNTWTYTVPSLIRHVTQVFYETNTSQPTYPYTEIEGCEVEENGKLRLGALPPIGRKLRVKGMSPLTDNLDSDAEFIQIDREQLEPFYWACEQYLWDYLLKTAPAADTERYSRLRGWAFLQYKDSLNKKAMQPPLQKVQCSHLESWR